MTQWIAGTLSYNQHQLQLSMLNTVANDILPIAQTNIPYLIASSLTAAFLLFLLIFYRVKFYPAAPIANILALLLFNDFFQTLFQLPIYLASPANALCLVSIAGTTFFRLAANYWLIFITQLIYRDRAAPGKQLDLTKHISKYLFATYLPSLIVSLLIIIIANVDNTQSEANCWRIITQKTFTDYVIYIVSFILPNVVAMVMIVVYLVAYIRISGHNHSVFLVYPIVAVPFMLYYLVIKMLTFLGEITLREEMELPYIIEPITHGIIFIFVLKKLIKSRPNSSDLTIKDDSNCDSFMVVQS